MNINLAEVSIYDGFSKTYEFTLDLTKLDFYKTEYKIITPISGTINLTFVSKEIVLVGNYSFEFELNCSRCLKVVKDKLSNSLDKVFHLDKEVKLTDDEESDDQFIIGHDLDVTGMICNDIYMNLPLQLLCKEDCNGLCPKCGIDLNVETCGCDNTNIDPRMEQFRDLLGKF